MSSSKNSIATTIQPPAAYYTIDERTRKSATVGILPVLDYANIRYIDDDDVESTKDARTTVDRAVVVANGHSDDAAETAANSSDVPRPDLIRQQTSVLEADTQSMKWSEYSLRRKLWVILKVVLKLFAAITCLYIFICALSLMSDSLRLLAGRKTNTLFNNELLQNPMVGLMIGLLVTVVLHSSSTATAITIAMTAAGVLPVENAIYIVMGANIGTSVTSSCVSFVQIGDRNEFQRAFAGASLGSIFNWLSVLVFLPLEVATGFLRWISGKIVQSMHLKTDKSADKAYLKILTAPVTSSILQLNRTLMHELSKSIDPNLHANTSVLRQLNSTTDKSYAFANTKLSDSQVGLIIGLASLAALCTGLVGLVRILHSLLGGKLAHVVKRFVNAHLPGPFRYFTGYLFIIFSAFAAILIQSSSIFTSTLTPLVGIGIVSLERMYTFTLGSDLGTTLTGVLAALATDSEAINVAMQVAMAHLVFNGLGIVLFYPIPFMRWPIFMAHWLGEITAKYRWFPVLYIALLYFILPGIVIALSLAGKLVLTIVLVPTLVLLLIIVIISVLQHKRPTWLPLCLENWLFLPEFLRSLEPYDKALLRLSCYNSFTTCSEKRRRKKDMLKKQRTAKKVDVEVDSNYNRKLAGREAGTIDGLEMKAMTESATTVVN